MRTEKKNYNCIAECRSPTVKTRQGSKVPIDKNWNSSKSSTSLLDGLNKFILKSSTGFACSSIDTSLFYRIRPCPNYKVNATIYVVNVRNFVVYFFFYTQRMRLYIVVFRDTSKVINPNRYKIHGESSSVGEVNIFNARWQLWKLNWGQAILSNERANT